MFHAEHRKRMFHAEHFVFPPPCVYNEGGMAGRESLPETERKEMDELRRLEKEAESRTPVLVGVDEIMPNPYQSRRNFDEQALAELAESIGKYGVLQPVLVRKAPVGYYLIAGERRWRASKMAGLESLPAIAVEMTDERMEEVCMVENIQREDLNPVEEARGYRSMMERRGLTQEQMAAIVGKSRPYIANSLRLLKMPDAIQDLVASGRLGMGHVKPLLALKPERAVEIATQAAENGWTSREVEDCVKRRRKTTSRHDDSYAYAERLMRNRLGTKVRIADRTVTFSYSGPDDLNRILELIGAIEDI